MRTEIKRKENEMKAKWIKDDFRVILMTNKDVYVEMLHIDDFSDLFGKDILKALTSYGEIELKVEYIPR